MKTIFFSVLLFGGCQQAAAQATAPAWKLGFGLDERLRVESRNNFDFNEALDDSGGYMFQRLRLTAKAELPGKYEFFAEGIDARMARHGLPYTAQDDNLDLHQAYAHVKGLWLNLPLEVKVGRQELKYGKGRILWAAVWGNRINHLDAAVLKYKKNGLSADAFFGRRNSYDPDSWNTPNRHDELSGVYLSYRKTKDSPLVEGYFVSNHDSEDRTLLDRNTVGLRAAATLPLGVALDAELPYQYGKAAGKNVYALAFHADLSREFKTAWSPRVMLAYNYASGDKDKNDGKNNTFIPVYQAPHEPYGIIDLFRWQNMREWALELCVKPAKAFKVTAAANLFWLADRRDYWYNSAGSKVRSTINAAADAYVGQETSLIANYDFGGGFSMEGAYARFTPGGYVKDTGTEDPTDFGYLQLGNNV
jgi:hypothetical protein